MHPVQHLETSVIREPFKPRLPSTINFDPALGSIQVTAPRADRARRPWRPNAANEKDTGVGLVRQRRADLPGSNGFCRSHFRLTLGGGAQSVSTDVIPLCHADTSCLTLHEVAQATNWECLQHRPISGFQNVASSAPTRHGCIFPLLYSYDEAIHRKSARRSVTFSIRITLASRAVWQKTGMIDLLNAKRPERPSGPFMGQER
jgi:hypothetical protein